MTLPTATVKTQYNGDGATITFAVPFVFWDDDDLRLTLTDAAGDEVEWVRGTHYSVSGGDGTTGSVTVVTTPNDYTPASGERLTITSDLPAVQETDLPAGGPFPSGDVEEQLDKTVRLIQQRLEELERALKLSPGSTFSNLTVPDPVAGKVLRWNSDASGLENVDGTAAATSPTSVADGGTGAVTAAAARVNLGIKDYATSLARFYHGGI